MPEIDGIQVSQRTARTVTALFDVRQMHLPEFQEASGDV